MGNGAEVYNSDKEFRIVICWKFMKTKGKMGNGAGDVLDMIPI